MPGTEKEWDFLIKDYSNCAESLQRRDGRAFDAVTKPEHYNTKRCGTCREELPVSAFSKNRAKKDGLQERCKACRAAHYVNSGYSEAVYWKTILRKYNIDVDNYEKLLKEQDYRCAICKISCEESMLVVDHNHETGRVRGLLCSPCNRGLGFFRDDTEALQTAVGYISRDEMETSCTMR